MSKKKQPTRPADVKRSGAGASPGVPREMQQFTQPAEHPPEDHSTDAVRTDENVIDEAVEESFPASDPPGFTPNPDSAAKGG